MPSERSPSLMTDTPCAKTLGVIRMAEFPAPEMSPPSSIRGRLSAVLGVKTPGVDWLNTMSCLFVSSANANDPEPPIHTMEIRGRCVAPCCSAPEQERNGPLSKESVRHASPICVEPCVRRYVCDDAIVSRRGAIDPLRHRRRGRGMFRWHSPRHPVPSRAAP